jgi:hypothetical protein
LQMRGCYKIYAIKSWSLEDIFFFIIFILMTSEQISKFVDSENVPATKSMKIAFKKRNPVHGLIVKSSDYPDLSSKNFWRIVPHPNVEKWLKSKDINLSRIYNGTEITKLSIVLNKEISQN